MTQSPAMATWLKQQLEQTAATAPDSAAAFSQTVLQRLQARKRRRARLLVTVGIAACTSAAALTSLPLGLHAFQLDMMQAAAGLLLLAFMMVLMLME
jgi:hypothetical protein